MVRGRGTVFYGWVMVVAGFLCYGLGLATGYVSWGYYGPDLIEALGGSKSEHGLAFGLFLLTYSLSAPLAAYCFRRFGLRLTMSAGLATAGIGFFLVSRAQSMWDCYFAYSLLGGIGVGLGAQLPVQTIAATWFVRYRARALAVMLTGGGVAGLLMPYLNRAVIEGADWRLGWQIIGAMGMASALLAALLVRNRPQDLGTLPDGATPEVESPTPQAGEKPATKGSYPGPWSAREAIRTRQFLLITIAAFGSSAPWSAWTAHNRLHLESLGLSLLVVTNVLAVGSMFSTWGRFAAAGSDFFSPPKVLSLSLFLEGVGIAGLVFSGNPTIAFVSVSVFSLGFGISLLAVPLVFAHFFGPHAFAGAQGTSRMIIGIVRLAAPTLTGVLADVTGSYTLPFLGCAALGLGGSLIALYCPPPRPRAALQEAS